MANLFAGRQQIPFYYSCFGYTRGNGSIWHGGLDVLGVDSTTILMPDYNGQSISGTVVTSRIVDQSTGDLTWEWGYYVCVQLDAYQTPDAVNYLYFCHNEQNLVKVGDKVVSGDAIAIMGNTGNAAIANPPIKHVHFEVRATSTSIGLDPSAYTGLPNVAGTYGESSTDYEGLILDVSKYQPTIDYAKAATDIDGVILRIGLTYWGAFNMAKDDTFDAHYNGFKAQGTPVGAYYYSCANTLARAEEEANFCIQLMRGLQFELPIYYDVENVERQGPLTKKELTAIVEKFCSILEDAGYYVGYYSNTSWLLTKLDTQYLSTVYTLWKADYRTDYDTTIPCDLFQYTNSGTVNGISGGVDLSYAYKNFVPIIVENGFNGFSGTIYEPQAYIIGFASSGDITLLVQIIEKEDVQYTVKDGYIITGPIKDSSLALELTQTAAQLGIPYKTYDYTDPDDGSCENDNELQEQIDALEEQIDALNTQLTNQKATIDSYTNKLNNINLESTI